MRDWKPGLALAALASATLFNPLAPAPVEAASGGKTFDLRRGCTADHLQRSFAAAVPGVRIGQVPNGPTFEGGVTFVPASGSVPAYCQVTGSYLTNPATGKTANFLATLPENWNGKYLQLGCGGNCGRMFATNNAADPGSVVALLSYPLHSIEKGYASFSNDGGHDASDTASIWAASAPGVRNEDGVADFYYRASQVQAQVAKQVLPAFYSSISDRATGAVTRSYFMGCSGGGRDGLVAASYFPEEFDGIVAGSPYANPMGVAFHYAGQTLAPLRSSTAAVPAYLAERIAPIVTEKCDAIDGLKDGIIQNPMACDFRADRDLPLCDGTKPATQCFTREQMDTISTRFSAVTDEHGVIVQPGFSVSEAQLMSTATPPGDVVTSEAAQNAPGGPLWTISNENLQFLAFRNEPGFRTQDLISFRHSDVSGNFHTVVPRSAVDHAFAAARMGTATIPENLDGLMQSRTRLLLWSNLSDNALSPYMLVNYYKQLAARFGGYERLQNHARFFPLPGTDHCGGSSVGPGTFDALTALEQWVEEDKAPAQVEAALFDPRRAGGIRNGTPIRTMPVCMFPAMARYKGEGDINDAANWFCPAGDQSLLTVGESGRLAGVVQ